MCSGPHLVFHLLQHHAPCGKRGPAKRHLHPFPNRQQSLQLWHLLAHTKTIEELIRFSDAAENLGLTISLKKTEVLYQPPPHVAYSLQYISIDGTNLNTVEHFTFLGSIISNDATVSKDLDSCLSGASSSF